MRKSSSDKSVRPRGATEVSVKKALAKPKGLTAARWNDAIQSRDELVEAKRQAMIRAAGRAFRLKGFHGTSLDEVAAALNVTKPTLYYYVNSKQDLLYRCHNYALDLGEQALVHAREGRSGLDRLQRMLTRYVELITNDFASYSLLSDVNDMSAEQRAAIQKRRRGFDREFRSFVEQGIEDGSIRPCEPKVAVAWFMGAVNGIPRWFDPDGALSGADVARMYCELVTRGLEAPAGKGSARRSASRS